MIMIDDEIRLDDPNWREISRQLGSMALNARKTAHYTKWIMVWTACLVIATITYGVYLFILFLQSISLEQWGRFFS